MGLYLFENIKTGEFREVFFHMDDEKIYNGEKENEQGLWQRRFFAPNAATDTNINPFSAQAFADKTSNSKGVMNDLWRRSEDLSGARASERDGVDPLKQKYYDGYAAKRKGKRSLREINEKMKNATFEF